MPTDTPENLDAPVAQPRHCTLTRGPRGFGLRINPQGGVEAHTSSSLADAPPVGARIVGINGVRVSDKAAIIAQLRLVPPADAADFAWEPPAPPPQAVAAVSAGAGAQAQGSTSNQPPAAAGLGRCIAELPSSVQLQIAALATVGANPPPGGQQQAAALPFRPVQPLPSSRYAPITGALSDPSRSFVTVAQFVSPALAASLRELGQRMRGEGQLRPAGIGTGPTRRRASEARGDEMAWLPSEPARCEEFPLSVLLWQFAAIRAALSGCAPRWAAL
jgi:hypothetical protein